MLSSARTARPAPPFDRNFAAVEPHQEENSLQVLG